MYVWHEHDSYDNHASGDKTLIIHPKYTSLKEYKI